MKVILKNILDEMAEAIEKAEINGRTVMCIELTRLEWGEYIDLATDFHSGEDKQSKFHGVTVREMDYPELLVIAKNLE